MKVKNHVRGACPITALYSCARFRGGAPVLRLLYKISRAVGTKRFAIFIPILYN